MPNLNVGTRGAGAELERFGGSLYGGILSNDSLGVDEATIGGLDNANVSGFLCGATRSVTCSNNNLFLTASVFLIFIWATGSSRGIGAG